MGLDSVELVMEWERFFEIEIPNQTAEKINTVQDAVDAISAILNVEDDNAKLKQDVFHRLQKAIARTGFTQVVIHQSDLVSSVFPNPDKQKWAALSAALGLEIPFPPGKPKTNFVESKILKVSWWTPKFDYNTLTFSELTDVVCGQNYKVLIDTKSIKTRYEIYSVLMALTVDKIGIDVYEFKPERIFTGDFGID